MEKLEHPLFYHAPVAIRFEIGGSESVYLDTMTNPEYISQALKRAMMIYKALPQSPNVLRIDGYPDEAKGAKGLIQTICCHAGLPRPHEIVLDILAENDEQYEQIQLYWDLSWIAFQPEKLLQEIIKSDIGGQNCFTSNVYLLNTNCPVLYYLYDERGLDVLSGARKMILPLYHKFQDWILDYDRVQIDSLFTSEV